jgi:type II secretory pathway predicted ATPase ExeA
MEKIAEAPSVLLVGNSELKERLMEHWHWPPQSGGPLSDRSFSTKETDAYIRHRMMAAGASRNFYARVEAICQFSGGIPKSIDLICDHALMRGYLRNDEPLMQIAHPLCQRSPKTFRLEKGAGLSFEGAARLKAKQ